MRKLGTKLRNIHRIQMQPKKGGKRKYSAEENYEEKDDTISPRLSLMIQQKKKKKQWS